jgi:hypothetical protein
MVCFLWFLETYQCTSLEEVSAECNTVEGETKLPEDCEINGVKELAYFMNLFKIPSVNLCKTAMDRLHLKVGYN